jgi:hypothetical protein
MPYRAKLPVIALVNTFPNASYPIPSVAPLAAAKNIAAPFRTRMGSACISLWSAAALSSEMVMFPEFLRAHDHASWMTRP